MATLDDILAATKIIAEAETLVAGSDSKPEVNPDMDVEGRIGGNDGSATSGAVSKRADEVKTVVAESSKDRDGELHSGSGNQQIDETGVLDSVSNGGLRAPLNEVGIMVNGKGYSVDKKIENGEGPSEPAELLSKLKHFAKVVYVENALELAVLTSRISAFYRFKFGGHSYLSSYHDPVPVEGLEDENTNETLAASDFSVPIEVPILGPVADWLSSPSKATSDEKVDRKRKHKSIADIIGENTNVKPKSRKRATVKERTDSANETTLQKRNKIDYYSSETSALGGVNGDDEGDVSEKQKEIEIPSAENTHIEEKEALEPLTSPRERKKSKYLSPPFTNVQWRMGNSSFKVDKEIGSDKIPKNAGLRDHKTKASEEKHPDENLERFDASANKSPENDENDKKLSFSISDVDVSLNEFLSKLRCAAVDPLYSSKEGSSDMVFAFGSALRSSTYVHGSDSKALRQCKGTRKRKMSSLLHETVENDLKSSKAVKTEDTSRPKKKAKASKSNVVKLEGKASPCLVLTFLPGSVLPSKEDILKHFRKFGSLNEKETSVLPDSNFVQVVFINESDVNKAFKSSVRENSFGFQNIYETQIPSSSGSSSKDSLPLIPTHEGQDSSDDLVSDARVITTKLEIMTAILAKYQSKFSSDDKSMLKEDMKHLMENVDSVSVKLETVSEYVRAMAEETSS